MKVFAAQCPNQLGISTFVAAGLIEFCCYQQKLDFRMGTDSIFSS